MKIAIGNDHAGFQLKLQIISSLQTLGTELLDCGCNSEESVDFPDFVELVAQYVLNGKVERGIVICGSGIGASIAANKIPGVRAGICHDTYSAHQGVEHNDMNIIALGARIVGKDLAIEIVNTFVFAKPRFEEKYIRRLNKIKAIESRYLKS